METEDNGKKQRDITYRVGWKTGKIQWDEQAKLGKETKSACQGTFSDRMIAGHTRFVWRQGLSIPDSLLFPLLYLLPAVSFSLTVLLIYVLSRP
jgi:hypothetical protein